MAKARRVPTVSDMSEKAEYLRQMGWTQELIEHFMLDDFDEDDGQSMEDQSPIVESNSMTLKFERAKTSTKLSFDRFHV